MKNTPIKEDIVKTKIKESGLANIHKSSIREMVRLVNEIEKASGIKFFRMEMGVPGLPSPSIGVEAEISAISRGVTSVYPPMDGIPSLKTETSRFLKLFANADILPEGCIPTVGSMQASMAAIMVNNRVDPSKNKTLFIDPGFPVHKVQVKTLGFNYESFDIFDYRGDKLKPKLESYLQKGDISTILYSNPNNPSWVCLNHNELQDIAQLADRYNVIVIEDLAYFGMDFRENISIPGEAPYQPSIRQYTDNCILIISGSKIFSYAGQRIGVIAIPDKLMHSHFESLNPYFGTTEYGHAIVYGALYGLSAGTAHSAQYALAEMLKAANDGKFNFVEYNLDYQRRATIMKKLFTENDFYIVYDKDEDAILGDGFYFTVNYPGFTGGELMKELLYYGISAVTLDITGSKKEGLRACVSQFKTDQASELEKRLKLFREHHRKPQEGIKL